MGKPAARIGGAPAARRLATIARADAVLLSHLFHFDPYPAAPRHPALLKHRRPKCRYCPGNPFCSGVSDKK
ncbi:hypothetical protein [Pseudoramibacter alactolyticus]|uniref:hypothetical protein n=1 Tax=Pseudoramibacter alactolyticus TaxID=113287 RepID=UPI00248DD7CC|nr:hypothetical protein [Pseudoramibacter alactolyticus]